MGLLELRRELRDLRRLRHIIAVLVEQGYHAHMAEARLLKHAPWRTRLRRFLVPDRDLTPQRARETLEQLGPTFVKLGQVLSLRSDLVPEEYCAEFRKLQDRVAPVEFSLIKATVEAELKQPLHEIFREFAQAPIASASISQVHKAVLRDGREVVVKVQRPGVRETIARDIDIMEYVARRVDQAYRGVYDACEVVAEFKRYTESELDFQCEMRHMRRFRENLARNKNVIIPEVFPRLCTGRLLVMEFIDGVPLSDKAALAEAGFSAERLADICIESLVQQAFEFGLFHADPHPGNLFAVKRGKQQALAFLDFGIVGSLGEELRQELYTFFRAIATNDPEQVTEAVLRIGRPAPGCDPRKLQETISARMEQWGGDALDGRTSMLVYTIINDALHAGVEIPSNIVLLGKAFVTIEGTGMWLSPKVNVRKKMQALTKGVDLGRLSRARKGVTRTVREMGELLEELPELTHTLAQRIKDGRLEMHLDARELDEAEHIYDLESSKRSLGQVLAALLLGCSVIVAFSPDVLFLGLPVFAWMIIASGVVLFLYLRVKSKIHKYLHTA